MEDEKEGKRKVEVKTLFLYFTSSFPPPPPTPSGNNQSNIQAKRDEESV